MLTLLLFILLVRSSIVDYRFSINFGMYFWDYSGNNNHGQNQVGSTATYLTDRDTYLLTTDSRVDAPDSLTLPTSVTYLAWVMPTDSEFRLLFRLKVQVIDTILEEKLQMMQFISVLIMEEPLRRLVQIIVSLLINGH